MPTGRILVTGAAGRLGSAILEAFADRDTIALTRSSLDVTDPAAVRRAVRDAAPSVVINCAAFNFVDEAETRPADALALNAAAVRSLARAAEAANAAFVHFGTDFVFDGTATVPYTEDSVPGPRSTYAATKLLGDWFALDVEAGYVLRVESLFGEVAGWRGRRGSLDGIVDGLTSGNRVKVFTDRIVSPSYVLDIARATRHLVDSGADPGLYHCVNTGHASWYDVAVECAAMLGVTARLEPITLETQPMPAARPRFCAMANGKLAAAGFVMPAWQDAVRRWLLARESGKRTLQ